MYLVGLHIYNHKHLYVFIALVAVSKAHVFIPWMIYEWAWKSGGVVIGKGRLINSEKQLSTLSLCPTRIPRGLPWERSWAFAVRSLRMSTWTMAVFIFFLLLVMKRSLSPYVLLIKFLHESEHHTVESLDTRMVSFTLQPFCTLSPLCGWRMEGPYSWAGE